MPDIDRLSADFARLRPDAFARVLLQGSHDEIVAVLRRLPPAAAAGVVVRLPNPTVAQLAESAALHFADWLAGGDLADARQLLTKVPTQRRIALINAVTDTRRRQSLNKHQRYPTNSVGALVHTPALLVNVNRSPVSALEQLGTEDSDPHLVVGVDDDGNYRGVVSLWNLLRAASDGTPRVEDLIDELDPIRLEVPVRSALTREAWRRHSWLPVVDRHRRVLGIVSRQQLLNPGSGPTAQDAGTGHPALALAESAVSCVGSLLTLLLGARKSA